MGILHQCVLLMPHSVHRLWQRQKNIDLLFHPILGTRIGTGRTSLRITHRVTRAVFSTLCVLKKSDISSHKSPTYEASSETLYTEHAHAFLRSFLNERLFFKTLYIISSAARSMQNLNFQRRPLSIVRSFYVKTVNLLTV